MAKKPVTRVAAKDKSTLLLAFDHVELACHGPANYAPYCLFSPGWLVGYDGIVAAGYRITEELHVAPHTETARQALMRAGNPFSLTTLSSGNVVVRGDAVRVEVPCVSGAIIPNSAPDAPLGQCNAALVAAMVATAKIVAARNERVITSCVLLREHSVVGTDGNTILEAHHGNGIAGQHLIPREFIDALAKVKTAPTHYGWGEGTFTLWFGPATWLRCNTYQERYPDTDVHFAQMIADCVEYRPVPTILLQAVETLKPFLASPQLTVTPYGLNTLIDQTGASYSFEHWFPADWCRTVAYEALRQAATHGEAISFNPRGFYWYGQELRGITRA